MLNDWLSCLHRGRSRCSGLRLRRGTPSAPQDILGCKPCDMGSLAVLGDHGSYDRSLDDQAQFLGNDIRIAGPTFHNQRLEPFNYLFPIRTGHILYPGTILFTVRHSINEYTTEEVFLLEPVLQQAEQGEDAILLEHFRPGRSRSNQ